MAADTPDQNLAQYFPVCNDFIHAARLKEGNVLIHCLAGMSRSVTVAVAYIMSVTPLTWKDALKVVRAGRAVANPNLGFQDQLQDFEQYKVLEERMRLKERFPSIALSDFDKEQCFVALDTYEALLLSKTLCEGHCNFGKDCPTGRLNIDDPELSHVHNLKVHSQEKSFLILPESLYIYVTIFDLFFLIFRNRFLRGHFVCNLQLMSHCFHRL